jgi:hypothetical protein
LKKLIDRLERLPQVVGQERIAAREDRQQFVHIFATGGQAQLAADAPQEAVAQLADQVGDRSPRAVQEP